MIKASSAHFSEQVRDIARFGRLLSHPARPRILKLLAKREFMTCGEIVEALPFAQATVSRHLRELTSGGLIRLDVEGLRSFYSLDNRAASRMQTCYQEFFRMIASKETGGSR
ncbi:MAG TPA: metalloregulator ArsR/SmtB family transcription factor [Leptospiraceae bacterium]|nr:metalloregulator ArsR/SmtB family transcription factor [Leptospirales bacterium]HMU81830.1 metalloregulator ArsR/SmtB family transcription factor [Leptospiraceae bacterium]HMW59216.1 metalloregulator ArsR/SmtB family transcription factor [Leptospiraceae bacterium]HMX55480.1 metalloregulator ArsR/SmtB family transcription factor [Leptospiraceae bacterium]HMY43846.1 metalloregulator ArsR/SmtB family transcription factor [Leptospiraceae bacterium]